MFYIFTDFIHSTHSLNDQIKHLFQNNWLCNHHICTAVILIRNEFFIVNLKKYYLLDFSSVTKLFSFSYLVFHTKLNFFVINYSYFMAMVFAWFMWWSKNELLMFLTGHQTTSLLLIINYWRVAKLNNTNIACVIDGLVIRVCMSFVMELWRQIKIYFWLSSFPKSAHNNKKKALKLIH